MYCVWFRLLAERERCRSREPWGISAIPEEPEAEECVAAATTTTTEIVSESPRPLTPTAVSSVVEDELFDIGGDVNFEEEKEETVSETTTTTTTVAPIVVRRIEPEQEEVAEQVVEEEERRTSVVGWGNVETTEGEEE